MPTSGSVQKGGDGQVDEPSSIDVLAEGPRPDAAPLEIVESFLVAGSAGFRDDFVVARQYLAGQARSEWQPLAGVVVSGALEFAEVGNGQVQVEVPVVARVDSEGRYAEAPTGAESSLTFGLVQDEDDQWRISDAPDGLVVPTDDFELFFRQTPIYFLSPDDTFLVPEQRWLPVKSRETSVVSALLAGPSPWLRDAVRTEVPDGVQLKPEAVRVDEHPLGGRRVAEDLDAPRSVAQALDHAGEERRGFDRLGMERDLPRLDPRDHEQVLDEADQPVGLLVDDPKELLDLLGRQLREPPAEGVHEAADRRERGAQLVAGDRDEVRFHLVELAQPGNDLL